MMVALKLIFYNKYLENLNWKYNILNLFSLLKFSKQIPHIKKESIIKIKNY